MDQVPPHVSDGGPPSGEVPATSGSPEIESIGSYKIVRLLGRGFTGRVFMAIAADEGRTRCAIKVLDPEAAYIDKQFLNVHSRVKHPNLMPCRGVEFDPNYRHCPVMDFLHVVPAAEENLDHLTSEETVAVFLDAARALEVLHAAGVVHGNLKPSNLLVRKSAAETRAILGDTGVRLRWSRERFRGAGAAEVLPYLAPEAVESLMKTSGDETLELKPTADVYSFAATFCAAYTGRTPFAATDQASVDDYLEAKRKQRYYLVQRMDEETGVRVDHLNELVRRCLSPVAADRPASGAELVRELEGCLVKRDNVEVGSGS